MPELACDCSDEFGPCEQHGTTLVVREGASQRTADELALVLVQDLIDCGVTLSSRDVAEFKRLSDRLEDDRDTTSGTAWFADAHNADAAYTLADIATASTELWVIQDDGYRIVRVHPDCPLL